MTKLLVFMTFACQMIFGPVYEERKMHTCIHVMQEFAELYFNLGLHYKNITALLASHCRYIVS